MLSDAGVFLRGHTLDYQVARGKVSARLLDDRGRVEQLLRIANEIIGICKTWKVKSVGIRGYGDTFAAHQVGEAVGALRSQLWLALKIVGETVSVATASAHLLGCRRPNLEQVGHLIQADLGYDCKDSEVTAALVARFVFDKKAAEAKQKQETRP